MQGLLAGYNNLRAAHIAGQFNARITVVNDNLKKGIVDEFRYGENSKLIVIKKTGKELKAALNKEKVRQETVKQTLLNKMAELQEAIGEDPTQPADNWRVEEFPNLPVQPKSYDVYTKREAMSSGFTGKEECDALCQNMYTYNNLCYKYSDACVQSAMLDTLINNVEDKKTYPLNLRLATMLGL